LTGTSSVGRLEETGPFGPLWIPALSDPNAAAFAACTASIYTSVTNAGNSVSYSAQDAGQTAILRTLGCLLIWSTPAEGLPDALESLSEIRAHTTSLKGYTPTPVISHEAKIGQKSERPHLVIDSEP
jgi:hypothetical protein